MDRGSGQGENRQYYLIIIIIIIHIDMTIIIYLFIIPNQIENDEADLAVAGFSCTIPRSKVVQCLPGVVYMSEYWHTR